MYRDSYNRDYIYIHIYHRDNLMYLDMTYKFYINRHSYKVL